MILGGISHAPWYVWIAVLALVLWTYEGINKKGQIISAAIAIILGTNLLAGGVFSGNVEHKVKVELIDWSGGSYDNIHIKKIKKVNKENGITTYNWEADFKYQGTKASQSGFIYLYKNGDVEDFKVLNDLTIH